jgi:hypothetical protein
MVNAADGLRKKLDLTGWTRFKELRCVLSPVSGAAGFALGAEAE